MVTKASEAAKRGREARRYQYLRDLEEAYVEAVQHAHDSGRVASGGRLHPTPDYTTCPSMFCEGVRDLLASQEREGSG